MHEKKKNLINIWKLSDTVISSSENRVLMRQQHRQLMHWHLAHIVPDKRNSCSQSVSTLPYFILSVFFTADVTQKTDTLATHSEEPVIVSNSTLDTYLVGR